MRLQQRLLLRRRGCHGAAILRGHVAIERGQPAVRADRNLALAARTRAIEARPAPARRSGCAGLLARPAAAASSVRCSGAAAFSSTASAALRSRAHSRGERRERRDDCVGVAQQHHRSRCRPRPAAWYSRRRTLSVRRPPTTATPGGRSSDSDPEQFTAPVLLSSLSITGFSIRTTANGEPVIGRLVAPAQLRRAPKQFAFDEAVGALLAQSFSGSTAGSTAGVPHRSACPDPRFRAWRNRRPAGPAI